MFNEISCRIFRILIVFILVPTLLFTAFLHLDWIHILIIGLIMAFAILYVTFSVSRSITKTLTSFATAVISESDDFPPHMLPQYKALMQIIKGQKDTLLELNLSLEQEIRHRKEIENSLNLTLIEIQKRKEEVSVLLRGTSLVLESRNFTETAQAIFNSCKELIGASAGYVSLLTEDGQTSEIFF